MVILKLSYLGPIIILLRGLRSFVSSRKHLLNTLLSLEFIILSIFWLMTICVVNLGGDIYFVLFFLTLAACEGALGLGLLIRIVRTHGNDNFRRFNTLSC